MKNLCVSALVRSVRLCRHLMFPAKVLLAQVAVSSSSVQILFNKNGRIVKDFGSQRKVHLSVGLACIIAVISFVTLEGEGVSLAYRSAPTVPSSAEVTPALVTEAPIVEDLRSSEILVSTAAELIQELKQENLWNIEELDRLPNVLISKFPADLASAAVSDKKRAFIVSVIPAAMVVLNEVRDERLQLLNILGQLGGDPADVIFSKGHPGWHEALSGNNVEFIEKITAKYRTEKAEELLNRVNVLPLSLIVAQGAIESSWGSSRFAIQANNLFGMWTWGKKGLIPLKREPGKTHRIALYDNILDSVRAYVLTLNRVSAYDDLRKIRSQTLDSFSLSEGLLRYSQRKELYVEDVKRVIEANNLKDLDGMSFTTT